MSDALERGELVEPFGPAGRITSPYCYWLIISPAHRARPTWRQFCDWVEAQAALTRGHRRGRSRTASHHALLGDDQRERDVVRLRL